MRNGRTVQLIEGIAKEFGFPTPPNPFILYPYLNGAEEKGKDEEGAGDGTGSGDGDSGAGSEDGENDEGKDGDDDDSGDGSGEPKTFDAAVVKKLRSENAAQRIRTKAAEEELDKRKKAEMDELTLAKTLAEEEKVRADSAETELAKLRLQLSVSQAATTANFHDPNDALSLIPGDSIALDDDGTPNKQSVEFAVKRLADSKPHLVKGKGTGTGDGGARGKGAGSVETKQAEYQQQFQQSGGVPRPTKGT